MKIQTGWTSFSLHWEMVIFNHFHASCVDVCVERCEATVCGISHCTLSPEFAGAVVGETGCCSGCFRVMSLGEYCKKQTACLTDSMQRENLDLFYWFRTTVKTLHHHSVTQRSNLCKKKQRGKFNIFGGRDEDVM